MKKLMSNAEYHAHEAIGSTTLKKIAAKSVLHAMSEEFSQTPAMVLGSAAHAAILEPETFDAEFAIAPKVDRRTKVGKEAWADFVAASEGKTVLTEEQARAVAGIKAAVLEHPIAREMITGGEAECSYFAKCPETGLLLKCRPDYKKNGALIDLKTCADASMDGFTRACINLLYQVQAAFYLDVHNLSDESEKVKDFYFLAVESSDPHAVNTFKMGEVEINLGRELYKRALRELAEYRKDESKIRSFGYSNEIKEIQFPTWALEQMEVLA